MLWQCSKISRKWITHALIPLNRFVVNKLVSVGKSHLFESSMKEIFNRAWIPDKPLEHEG